MEKLDVLYTVNNKYLDIMLGSAFSLILNGNADGLRIHIIASDFSIEDYNKVETALCKFPNVEVYFYDMQNFDLEKYQIPNWRGSQIANARLFFQEYMQHNIDAIENLLYLDSDVIVASSLDGLNKYRDNVINAAKDGMDLKHIQALGLKQYFNSGVLYFNVEKWLNESKQEELIYFLEQNQKPLFLPDQDTLNCALEGEINEIPLSYNLGANAYLFSPKLQRIYYDGKSNISNAEVIEAKKDPKILHGIGVLDIKPWTNNNSNPYNDIFMKYILMGNPDFQKPEISTLKRLITINPEICGLFMILKQEMPTQMKQMVRKLVKF